MPKRRTILLALAIVPALLVVAYCATKGPPAPTPNPRGTFSFAVLGDAPYYPWEDLQMRLVLQSLDEHDLAWVVQVGDIFWRPCTDEQYRRSLRWYDGLRHPVVYTPGDNEWADCWKAGSGGFAPLDRLEQIRAIFFADPARSLGGRALPLASQGGSGPHGEFVENVRWTHAGIVFATVHVVGSMNAMYPFPGRTGDDDAAATRRVEAAAAWVREAFAETADATAVVIAFHGNPVFGEPPDDRYRQGFEPFLTALEEEAERFGGPVLVMHGDNHEYTVDRPLVRRTTGRRLDNLTRLQVPGSPDVGWVRVIVTPGERPEFAFELHVVPRWKFW